ncbi:Nucleotide-binding universal stress protein, UspA family [Halopenitus malekzadehii]|uniref:Nucleotide-binding universal stress protein, UspA family n=1 Tax=Halopenitus malekzadehii TaxID=1267564 RepID=A0A1H6HZX7_9EURY|nr:universal stress protein [Halopenitus malekzadehii]SEH39779.1 Nucleotide-binding universal stress protein, UspA family [Halopenitus malekzadehii]
MYHVLLAVDEDEGRSTRIAETITSLPSASTDVFVSVFHCFVDNPAGASATQVGSVRAVQGILEEAGIDNQVLEASGDPADTILEAAAEEQADAIYLGGRKRSPAGKALFGSVTQSVILGAELPVTVAGKTQTTAE